MVALAEPLTAPRTGWDAWSVQQADEARERYAFHRLRVARDERENDERLAAKAQAKLADLASHSRLTDPDALAAKRAVIEAAQQRAAARSASPAPGPARDNDDT
jgi:electron transport complex protein RnfB